MSSPTASPAAPTLTLGIDLTSAGARTPVHRRPGAAISSTVELAEVAEYLRLAAAAGAEVVTFGEAFRLDDAPRNDAWLDPAVIAKRLAGQGLPPNSPALVPALPAGFLDPVRLAGAIAGIHELSGGHGGWQVPTSPTAGGVHSEVRRAWDQIPGARVEGSTPVLVTAPHDSASAAVAGRHSDLVRLRVRTVEEARERRAEIREAASAAGRNPDDVRVLIDAITVIGADAASAVFRADLLRDLSDETVNQTLTIAGTARGVAEEIAAWHAAGAADGFVLIPGSLPTDAVAITQDLAPELAARGLLRTPAGVPSAVDETFDDVDEVLIGAPLVFVD